MNKKLRLVLFYLFVLVFIVFGFYLTISIQGFVINKNLKLEKRGGIYLNYKPQEAEIKINGKLKTKSGFINNFLQSGILISDLVPGTYHIELQYPGYKNWEKYLEVKPGIVTAKNFINLWPDENKWNLIQISKETSTDFWITNSGIIFEKQNNLYYNNKKIAGENIALSDNKKSFIITADKKGKYYFIFLNDSPTSSTLNVGEKIMRFIFHPFDENGILAITNKKIYHINSDNLEKKEIYAFNKINLFYQNKNEIFINNDTKGKILIADLFLKTQIDADTGITSTITKIKTSSDGNNIFIQTEGNAIYEYSRSNKKTELIFQSDQKIKDFFISPEDARIAVLTGTEIYIVAFKNFKLDSPIKKGATWKIEVNKEIADFLWLPIFPNHGIYKTKEGELFITELDFENPANNSLIAKGVNKVFLYENTLYLQKENLLYSLNLKNIILE